MVKRPSAKALEDTALHCDWGYDLGAAVHGKRARLRRILSAAWVAPSAAIDSGDQIRDIEAARGRGMAAGVVLWGYHSAQALPGHGPDRIFASMDEIGRELRSRRGVRMLRGELVARIDAGWRGPSGAMFVTGVIRR